MGQIQNKDIFLRHPMTKADFKCCCRWYKFMKSNNNKKLVKLDDRVKQVIENLY